MSAACCWTKAFVKELFWAAESISRDFFRIKQSDAETETDVKSVGIKNIYLYTHLYLLLVLR